MGSDRRAQSWTEVGQHPLSRRDRAAMELALWLTRNHIHPASDAGLDISEESAFEALSGARAALVGGRPFGPGDDLSDAVLLTGARVRPRLLRARLALALRTLLRVDRGDFGWIAWNPTWEGGPIDEHDFTRLPVRPLWESAPVWDATTRPAQRRTKGGA